MRLHESVFEAPQPSQEFAAPSSSSCPLDPADPPADPVLRRIADRSPRPRPAPRIAPLLASLPALVLAALLSSLLASLLACAPRSPSPFWQNEPDLVEVDRTGPGRLFVKSGHRLDAYDDVLLDDVGLRYRPGQARIAAQDERRILAMLVAAIAGDRDGGVAAVNHPGPCVLAVDYFLKDLELAEETTATGRATELRQSLGRATMVIELRDSQSDAVLARFVERRDLGGGRWIGGRREQLHRLEKAIGHAVDDLGRKLQRMESPPTTTELAEGCRGTILRAALDAR